MYNPPAEFSRSLHLGGHQVQHFSWLPWVRTRSSTQALLCPHFSTEQAVLIFQQGQDAVVFALLMQAKQIAEKANFVTNGSAPSTPCRAD